MKKKLSAGLILAIVLVLSAAAALAAAPLSFREILEQVAVPLATGNDTGAAANPVFSAGELAELVRGLEENGITLDENNQVTRTLERSRGEFEEEALMEICREAFGGNFYTWTLEEQDWYQQLMVKIGYYESYESCLPGEGNLPYEEAEAFAFRKIREEYGTDLPLEDRSIWALERQFYREPADPSGTFWNFSLIPKDLDHGRYEIWFDDSNPEGTADTWADIHDWTQPYTGAELLYQFYAVYSWHEELWTQETWQKLHTMMQNANVDLQSAIVQETKAYAFTAYPEPDAQDIPKETAVRKAGEALRNPRIELESAVLTEYEESRSWMVFFEVLPEEEEIEEDGSGLFAVEIDSRSGEVRGIREKGMDDSTAFAYVPEAAYEKAWEGILRRSEIIRLAADAIRIEHPELDLLNREMYDVQADGSLRWTVTFLSKDIRLGNAYAVVSLDGTVEEIEADDQPLDGDNLFSRYWQVYGYFGSWDQSVWVQLGQDMAGLEPHGIDGELLKATRYPEESTVRIGHEEAKELGIRATGKRVAEVNTCVLADADPHPVWIMRILTDEPDDPVIGIDAETGETVFREAYKVDYTPHYTLYSMPEKWRKAELEKYGPLYVAKVAITHKFGDMQLDFPEIEVDNGEDWEVQLDGLTVRCTGRWKGMQAYETELDENGYVLRCEESDSPSTEEKPADYSGYPVPTPQPDGKPWIWGNGFAPEAYWERIAEAMEANGVTFDNLQGKIAEWTEQYGELEDEGDWPQDLFVIGYVLTAIRPDYLNQEPVDYPVFADPAKKSKEEIETIALQAFHEAADAEWVDAQKIIAVLWNNGIYEYYGIEREEPTWWAYIMENCDGTWESKGIVMIDEDGNVILTEMMLEGNG